MCQNYSTSYKELEMFPEWLTVKRLASFDAAKNYVDLVWDIETDFTVYVLTYLVIYSFIK